MEAYDSATVFSSIDRNGRYAYRNQPGITLWNLTRLAECLLPLMEHEEGTPEAAMESAKEALGHFGPAFEAAHLAGLRRKLGLLTAQAGDAELANDLLERMAANRADFTLTFRRLCSAAEDEGNNAPRTLFENAASFDEWATQWRRRLAAESSTPQGRAITPQERAAAMRRANPAFIPRNHLVQQVIDAAVLRQDFQPFEQLLRIVTHPYDDQPGHERYQQPARPDERVFQTFCGT